MTCDNQKEPDWVLWIFFAALCLCIIGIGYNIATLEPPHDVKFTVINKYVQPLPDGSGPWILWVIGDNHTWWDYPDNRGQYNWFQVGHTYNVRIEQGISYHYTYTEVTS
jgi:hypothetical protein